MIKRILIGLAGTDYTDVAVQTALELARLHGAELTGVTIVDPNRFLPGAVPIGGGGAAKELREHREAITAQHVEEAIGAFRDACTKEHLPHTVVREEGDAFERMLWHGRYHDLTVFGMRSVFEYYFEDVDSSQLLLRLVGGGVRPIVAVAKEYRPIKRALVAYNGSMESAKTLRRLVQLRPWPDMTLRIVTFSDEKQEGEQLLTDAAAYCRAHGLEPQVECVAGSAFDQLLDYAADHGADLIALGNSGRNVLLRQLFGEVTMHAIQNADRPLFLSQ